MYMYNTHVIVTDNAIPLLDFLISSIGLQVYGVYTGKILN